MEGYKNPTDNFKGVSQVALEAKTIWGLAVEEGVYRPDYLKRWFQAYKTQAKEIKTPEQG